ncbi:DNA-binding protein [Streptomyces avermitilis]|uniref:DNA-binding protein n=1 Tax=Streptomyces avermitilis TaxID=33903 RepID=UPI00340136DC
MSPTLVLDSEGLSQLVRDDRTMAARLAAAAKRDARVLVSSVTLVEARNPATAQARVDWAIFRLKIEPASESSARHASKLLAAAKLQGHKYAIVCATALARTGPVSTVTSDLEDIRTLAADLPRVSAIKV